MSAGAWIRRGGARMLSRRGAVLAVAGIAAYASYQHMRAVALDVGEGEDTALLLPLSVDALIVICADALLDQKANGKWATAVARTGFVLGVAASLGANIAAAEPHLGARIVAAWAPVALLITVEFLGAKSAHQKRARAASPQVEWVAPPSSAGATDPGAPATRRHRKRATTPAPPVVLVSMAGRHATASSAGRSATDWSLAGSAVAPSGATAHRHERAASSAATASSAELAALLRSAWDQERAHGRMPKASEVRKLAGGVGSPAYARKLVAEWREQERHGPPLALVSAAHE